MKLNRTEKCWLATSAAFFILYNLPGVPAFGDARGLALHGLFTVVPLWIVTYLGMFATSRESRRRKRKKEDI